MKIIYGLGAFVIGACLSYLNFIISKRFLSKNGNSIGLISMLRQLINIGYIVILFVFGRSYAPNLYMLLIGGALGVTIPSFFLTLKLVKGEKSDEKRKEDING